MAQFTPLVYGVRCINYATCVFCVGAWVCASKCRLNALRLKYILNIPGN